MIGIFEMVAPVITYIYKYRDTYIRDIKGREAIDYSSFMKVLKLWIMSIKERGGLNCCPLVRNRKETESGLREDLIHHFRGDSDHDDETLMKCWPIRIIKVFPRPKLLCYWAERTGHKRKRGRTVSTIAPTCTSFVLNTRDRKGSGLLTLILTNPPIQYLDEVITINSHNPC